MRIYALLDKDTALGFRLAGVEVHEAGENEDAKSLFSQSLQLKDIGILLISDLLASKVREEINAHLYGGGLPIVIEVRPLRGEEKKRKTIDELIRESIGLSV